MLRKYEPLRENPILYMGFYERCLYLVRRKYKLTSKQLTMLILCELTQYYNNGLFSVGGLRPFVVCKQWDVQGFVSVLESKGLIEVIPSARPRKTTKQLKKNVLYNMSSMGKECIDTFNRVLKNQIQLFKKGKKWKRINPEAFNYFESLGIIDYTRQRDSSKRPRLRPPDGLN